MAQYVSTTIQITRADLQHLRQATGVTIPIHSASKHGNTITYHTRNGTSTYTFPAPKRGKTKKERSTR